MYIKKNKVEETKYDIYLKDSLNNKEKIKNKKKKIKSERK
jgi:hypothetical protein